MCRLNHQQGFNPRNMSHVDSIMCLFQRMLCDNSKIRYTMYIAYLYQWECVISLKDTLTRIVFIDPHWLTLMVLPYFGFWVVKPYINYAIILPCVNVKLSGILLPVLWNTPISQDSCNQNNVIVVVKSKTNTITQRIPKLGLKKL